MKQQPIINEADIGKRIKSLRNKKRVTLETLAADTGFTKGYLSKVEKSVKAPPVSTLGHYCPCPGSQYFHPFRGK